MSTNKAYVVDGGDTANQVDGTSDTNGNAGEKDRNGVYIISDKVEDSQSPTSEEIRRLCKVRMVWELENGRDGDSPGLRKREVKDTANGYITSDAEDGRKKMNHDTELSESLLDVSANGHPKVVIERPIFNQQTFDEGFSPGIRPTSTARQHLTDCCGKCRPNKKCFVKFLYAAFPFLTIFRDYKMPQDLTGDIVSGLTVGIMHIPQGMAYGMLTGLDPVYGLYTSFFPVIVYFFFGSSRHISVGTFAVASLMVGSAIEKGLKSTTIPEVCQNVTRMVASNATNHSMPTVTSVCTSDSTELQLQYAMAVSLMAGFIMLVMGLLRLGFITTYLSDPLISGFTTGAACHVFTSQITHIFGISVTRYSGAFKLIYTYRDFFKSLPSTNAVTLITSVICILFVYLIKEYINNNPKIKPKLKMPVPVELIAVVLGTVISFAAKLEENYEVKNVGTIPKGLPVPSVPNFSLLPNVISDAFAIAIVVFAVSVSMGKILARKHEYEIDSNQELIAFAMTGIISSFFSAYLASASLSRSLIQEQVGGATQLTGLISCVLLLLVLLVLAPYFQTLPKCVLAAIIIVALKGMFRQLLELPRLWRLSKIDFFVWVITFLATVILDVDLGLLVGVITAILTIVYRVQRPYVCLMGQMPGTDIYRDVTVYKEAETPAGIRIFRFESNLFFVSVEHFRSTLYRMTCNPRKLKNIIRSAKKKISKEEEEWEARKVTFSKDNGSVDLNQVTIQGESSTTEPYNSSIVVPVAEFHTIILDCSTWSFIDSMGVKALSTIVTEFRDVDVNIYLALCKAGVREMFEKTGFFDVLDRENLFVSIHDAVLHAQNRLLLERSLPAVQDGDAPARSNVSSRRSSMSAHSAHSADGIPNAGFESDSSSQDQGDSRMQGDTGGSRGQEDLGGSRGQEDSGGSRGREDSVGSRGQENSGGSRGQENSGGSRESREQEEVEVLSERL